MSGLWRGEWSTEAVRWVTESWELLLLTAHLDSLYNRKNQENQLETGFHRPRDTKHSENHEYKSTTALTTLCSHLCCVKVFQGLRGLGETSCMKAPDKAFSKRRREVSRDIKQQNMMLIGDNSTSYSYWITNPWQWVVILYLFVCVCVWVDSSRIGCLSHFELSTPTLTAVKRIYASAVFDNLWHTTAQNWSVAESDWRCRKQNRERLFSPHFASLAQPIYSWTQTLC